MIIQSFKIPENEAKKTGKWRNYLVLAFSPFPAMLSKLSRTSPNIFPFFHYIFYPFKHVSLRQSEKCFNPFPNDKFQTLPNSKEFVDNNFKFNEMAEKSPNG